MITVVALIMLFQLGALTLVLALAKYSAVLVDENGHPLRPSKWQERLVASKAPAREPVPRA